jgi:hypothetical protein
MARLLSALLVEREREITDTLVELLISTVHTINARADRRVTEEMVASFKRVRNKNALLAKVAEASLKRPDGAVREVVYPAAGGESTLREVVAEYKASSPEFRRNVQVKLRASYSNHYRVGMIKLLRTLSFRSNNTTHAPIIDGIALVLRHAEGRMQSYPAGEVVPMTGIVEGDWVELAWRGVPGASRVVRTVYEVCLFKALRERLRCKEIWVEGADKFRDPEQDLPQTSCNAAASTTPSWASRWTRRSSWSRCAPRWAPSCGRCRRRCRPAAGCRSPLVGPAGSPCRRWRPTRSRGTCARSRPRSVPGGAWCRCWTC